VNEEIEGPLELVELDRIAIEGLLEFLYRTFHIPVLRPVP